MRIRIFLDLEGKTISASYKHFVQSLVYNMLGDNEKYNKLHSEGYKLDNRPFKLFVISDIIGKFQYSKDKKQLKFYSNGFFDIASLDEEISIKVAKYLSFNKSIFIGRTIIDHNGYKVFSDNYKIQNQMKFSSISPVTCYRNHGNKTKYFSPEDIEFSDLIISNLIKKHTIVYNVDEIEIKILKVEERRKRLVHFKKTFLIAYDINIVFENINSTLFSLIMNTGIGSKNSMGFGMLKYEN